MRYEVEEEEEKEERGRKRREPVTDFECVGVGRSVLGRFSRNGATHFRRNLISNPMA